jgi:hypothetical protein
LIHTNRRVPSEFTYIITSTTSLDKKNEYMH